nr:hypothetical protein GCM10020092_075110 [Actinoplanes digitatis]
MDEITVLRESFDPDAAPSPAARERARTALQHRMNAPGGAGRSRHWRLRVPIAISVATATAVVAAIAVTDRGGTAPAGPAGRQESTQAGSPTGGRTAAMPYLRPVSAAQYLENAAWSAERQIWTDPDPEQFMYVETRELRNPRGYENKYPNGTLVPGKAKYRKNPGVDARRRPGPGHDAQRQNRGDPAEPGRRDLRTPRLVPGRRADDAGEGPGVRRTPHGPGLGGSRRADRPVRGAPPRCRRPSSATWRGSRA